MKKTFLSLFLLIVFIPGVNAQTVLIGGNDIDVVTSGDGLYSDEYTPGKYVYRGTNPNNYIMFNNELWRIISKEADGTYKIIRNDPLYDDYPEGQTSGASVGCLEYDVEFNRTKYGIDVGSYCARNQPTESDGFYGFGCDAWSTTASMVGSPEEYVVGLDHGDVLKDSSMNIYLNTVYYNKLTEEAKNAIVSHNFNIGGININMPDIEWAQGSTLENTLKEESAYMWNGKIALMNVSDFMNANSNQEKCSLLYNVVRNHEECGKTNWLVPKATVWALNPVVTPYEGFGYSEDNAAIISRLGGVNWAKPSTTGEVTAEPVVYLNSSITLGGCGSKDDPYIIGGDKKCNADTENTGNVTDNESTENNEQGPQIVEVPSTSAYGSIIIAVLGIICVIVSVFVMRRVTKKAN